MAVEIRVILQDDGSVSVGTTEPMPVPLAIGCLDIAKAILMRPMFAPPKAVVAAPAGALHAIPKMNGHVGG